MAQLAEQPGELFDVALAETADPDVDRGDRLGGIGDDSAAGVGDLAEGGAAVGGVGDAAHEALILETVDDVGDAGGVDHEALAHLPERQRRRAG